MAGHGKARHGVSIGKFDFHTWEIKIMHCNGHVREAFTGWIEAVDGGAASINDEVHQVGDGDAVSIPRLLGELQKCTDVLPGDVYRSLDYGGRQTYAAAVRHVRQLRK
jgi:hypothetical protein